MNIHGLGVRIAVSVTTYVAVLLTIFPYLVEVRPPRIVTLLLEPALFLGSLVRMPCFNMGTAEHPVCEGTPFHLLVGIACIFFGSFVYPAFTFIALSIISGLAKLRGEVSLELK